MACLYKVEINNWKRKFIKWNFAMLISFGITRSLHHIENTYRNVNLIMLKIFIPRSVLAGFWRLKFPLMPLYIKML